MTSCTYTITNSYDTIRVTLNNALELEKDFLIYILRDFVFFCLKFCNARVIAGNCVVQ